MRAVVYVEGITEAGFVYQLIKKKYQDRWTDFRLECLNLDPESAADDLWAYGDENSENYYLIYDSCSDGSVSSDMLDRFENHRRNGFDRVIGLRDVYSDRYFDLYGRTTERQSVDSFINDMQEAIREVDDSGFVQLRFAIMETEAWMLAMSDVFSRIDPKLNAEWLLEKVKIDINEDPETAYVHPFKRMEEVFQSISKSYSKHWVEIKEIVFKLEWDDFDKLYNSGKCNSFRVFYDALFL